MKKIYNSYKKYLFALVIISVVLATMSGVLLFVINGIPESASYRSFNMLYNSVMVLDFLFVIFDGVSALVGFFVKIIAHLKGEEV